MKAIQFVSTCEARLVEVDPQSSPPADEVLVRTHRMGICGTDISAFHGKFPFFQFPRVPGHELGVEIIAVGENVTELHVGDRCALEPYFNNPNSPTSKRGLTNCCTDLQVFGVHCDGGLRSGSYAVPAHKLHVGNELSYDQLALVEPLAIGYHAVQRGAPKPGETVLVVGAGPIGLACLEFLNLLDVQLRVSDIDPVRLDFCRERFQISDTEGPADLVIDATGSARSMSTCFEQANFGGRVVYVGVTAEDIRFPHSPVFHRRELSLFASRNALSEDFPNIIRILSEGKIDLAPWMTHRLDIEAVPEQFAEVTHPDAGAIKAIIQTN